MCKIKTSLLLLSAFTGFSNEISLNHTFENVKERLEFVSGPIRNNFVTQQTQLSSLFEEIYEGLDLTIGLNQSVSDYSKIFINSREGIESPLSTSNDFITEHDLNLGFAFTRNTWKIQATGLWPVKREYFQTTSSDILIEKSFSPFKKIAVSYLEIQTKSPVSYFSDILTLERTASPSKNKIQRITGSWEDVLVGQIKSKTSLFYQPSTNLRPTTISLRQILSHAVTEKFFVKFSYSFAKELRKDQLKDSRGYFTNNTAQLEFTTEPLYDVLLAASYGIVLERESDPRIQSKSQVGLDQIALSARYTWDDLMGSVSVQNIASNSDTKITSIGGNLTWML